MALPANRLTAEQVRFVCTSVTCAAALLLCTQLNSCGKLAKALCAFGGTASELT